MQCKGRLAFTTLMAGVSLAMVIASFSYKKGAGLVPLVIGIPTFILFSVQLLKETEVVRRGKTEGHEGWHGNVPLNKELEAITTMVALVVLIYLLGYYLAVPVFLFLFVKIRSMESWKLSISLTAVTSICLYVLFVVVLNMPLYKGIFFE